MKIGSSCFADTVIKEMINSYKKQGICDFLGKNDFIYDTEEDNYLNGIFDDIIRIYTPVSNYPDTDLKENQTFLKDELSNEWNIFAEHFEKDNIYRIVKELSKEMYEIYSDVFDDPIVCKSYVDPQYGQDMMVIKGNDWSKFVYSIKHENRFHSDYVVGKNFERLASYVGKKYDKGTVFYRGRICDEAGKKFEPDEIGAPPIEKTVDGRANSKGIRRLYLADSPETVVNELKATTKDYITVGEFVLKEDITVVDLKVINKISPFVNENIASLLYLNRKCLDEINNEISKVARKNDQYMDYLATQYITDLIQTFSHNDKKSYAGIEYGSTLNDYGYNIALFDPNLCDCRYTELRKVERINSRVIRS